MKILHTVESYLPLRHGMSEVVRQISEYLAQSGHDVSVATSYHPARARQHIGGVRIFQFNISGRMATGIVGDVDKYMEFLLDSDFDVIVNFAAQQWATDLALPLLDQLKARKVLVPTGFSGLGDPSFDQYFQSMLEWLPKYDACIYLSKTSKDYLWSKSYGIEHNAVIIPNGASADEFAAIKVNPIRGKIGVAEQSVLILHVAGYLSFDKGQLDAVRIVDSCRCANSALLIVCPDFDQPLWKIRNLRRLYIRLILLARMALNFFKQTKLICLSLDRRQTVASFIEADLFLFPSRIECSPLVLFEAAASRTPFLSTAVGNAVELAQLLGSGMIMPSSTKGARDRYVVPDIKKAALILRKLLSNGSLLSAMAERGYSAWKAGFTWESIAARYEMLYLRIIS